MLSKLFASFSFYAYEAHIHLQSNGYGPAPSLWDSSHLRNCRLRRIALDSGTKALGCPQTGRSSSHTWRVPAWVKQTIAWITSIIAGGTKRSALRIPASVEVCSHAPILRHSRSAIGRWWLGLNFRPLVLLGENRNSNGKASSQRGETAGASVTCFRTALKYLHVSSLSVSINTVFLFMTKWQLRGLCGGLVLAQNC